MTVPLLLTCHRRQPKQKRTSVRISCPPADQSARAGESDQSTSSTERLRRDDVAEALRRSGWRRGRLHLSLGADGEVRLFPPDPFSIPLTARLWRSAAPRSRCWFIVVHCLFGSFRGFNRTSAPTTLSCCAALSAHLVDIMGVRNFSCKLSIAVSFLHAIDPNSFSFSGSSRCPLFALKWTCLPFHSVSPVVRDVELRRKHDDVYTYLFYITYPGCSLPFMLGN
jgi:hypothetical protein